MLQHGITLSRRPSITHKPLLPEAITTGRDPPLRPYKHEIFIPREILQSPDLRFREQTAASPSPNDNTSHVNASSWPEMTPKHTAIIALMAEEAAGRVLKH